MSSPKTLFELAGASVKPTTFANAALVLIDMQNEYLETGKVPLEGVNEALEQGKIILEKARQLGTPVIHVVHHGGKGFYDPEGTGGQLCDQVKPLATEPVVAKNRVSSFVGTDMLEQIQKTGRKELLVIGFMTHMCVSTFVRAATEQYGYPCTVIANATASRALPSTTDPSKTVPANHVRESALAAIADLFGCVVSDVSEIKDQ